MAALPHDSEQRHKHPQSAVKQHQNTQQGSNTDTWPGKRTISTDFTSITRIYRSLFMMPGLYHDNLLW